jgi:hypothetical protein
MVTDIYDLKIGDKFKDISGIYIVVGFRYSETFGYRVVQAKEDSGILYEFGYDYPPDAPVIVKIT